MRKVIFYFVVFACAIQAKAQNVGIGTPTPTEARLTIVNPAGNQFVSRTSLTGPGISIYQASGAPTLGFNNKLTPSYGYMGSGYGSFFQYDTATGKLRYFSSTASGVANTNMAATTTALFTIAADGNIGIGNSYPEYKLDVNGRMRIKHNGATAGLWFNQSDNTEGAFIGQYNDYTFGIYGPDNSGSAFWKFGFDLNKAWLGIGTATPKAGLYLYNRDIYLDDVLSRKSVVITASGTGNYGGEIKLFAHGLTDSTVIIRGSDGGSQGGEIIMIDPNDHTRSLELDGDYGGTGRSRIIVDELQIKGGADFAEYFDVAATASVKPEPGMLVSIDEENEGKLTVSTTAYDKKIAGIISGANGIKPGMMMGHKNTIANGEFPVAITGRVYVKAEAFSSTIHPGDLLTTSAIPGHAMKAVNAKKAQGAIIGKAMSKLEAGTKGMVLVLLGIQ